MLHSFLIFHSHCGIKDPTWAEIGHFVNFLAIQLHQCEKSIFCKPDIIGDVLTGFKTFVVKFMIQMSRVSIFSSIIVLLVCLEYYTNTHMCPLFTSRKRGK